MCIFLHITDVRGAINLSSCYNQPLLLVSFRRKQAVVLRTLILASVVLYCRCPNNSEYFNWLGNCSYISIQLYHEGILEGLT